MRDIELYDHWQRNMAIATPPSAAIEEWLRSGILRITTPITLTEDEVRQPPFFPFVGYATDPDDVLILMKSLRELASARSEHEATMLRTAVVNVISQWDFENPSLLSAIRLSFRIGSIFGCTEICDVLAGCARQLISSPVGVITGLSDMANDMAQPGRNLIILLLSQCAEQPQLNYLIPYLLTRAIESSVRADCREQRELVFGLMNHYGAKLNLEAIDTIEALTDVFITQLRLSEAEAPIDRLQAELFRNVAEYLDEDIIEDILSERPELQANQDYQNISKIWLEEHRNASNSNFENELLKAA